MSDSSEQFQWNSLQGEDEEDAAADDAADMSPTAEQEQAASDDRIAELEAALEAKEETIAELEATIANQNTEIESLKATIESLRKKNESLETSLEKLNNAQDQQAATETDSESEGAPQSIQDDLLEILEMLEHEVDGAVPYSRLIATAKNSGLPEEALDPALNTLIKRGDVVEPFSNQYRRYES